MTTEYARKLASQAMYRALTLNRVNRDDRIGFRLRSPDLPFVDTRYAQIRDEITRAMRIRCIIVAPVRPLPLP